MDHQRIVASGSNNLVTVLDTQVFDASWKPITEFPPLHEVGPMPHGHEMRSDVVWLYQAAHENTDHSSEKTTVWPGHIYLGMCISPLIKTADGYDYGDPYFIDIANRSVCAVTMWRNLDIPAFPFDQLEYKGRHCGTRFNPEFHKGNIVGDEGLPSNFA